MKTLKHALKVWNQRAWMRTNRTATPSRKTEAMVRLFGRLDKTTLRLFALLLFSACCIYTALSTLPFKYCTPTTSLDGSYGFGSNYFPNAGFRTIPRHVCAFLARIQASGPP